MKTSNQCRVNPVGGNQATYFLGSNAMAKAKTKGKNRNSSIDRFRRATPTFLALTDNRFLAKMYHFTFTYLESSTVVPYATTNDRTNSMPDMAEPNG
jgi:hypothetical protein